MKSAFKDNNYQPNSNSSTEKMTQKKLRELGYFPQKVEPMEKGGYSGVIGLDSEIKEMLLEKSNKESLESLFCSGVPDFVVIGEQDIFFVEAKSDPYVLRASQAEWIKDNPEFRVFVSSGWNEAQIYEINLIENQGLESLDSKGGEDS